MSEFIDVVTKEQLHDDCHQNVTEPSGHMQIYDTKRTNNAANRNCELGLGDSQFLC